MMKKVAFVLTLVLAAGSASLYLESCSKDEAPGALTLTSLATDGGVALDGATAASAVPLSASVVATFNKAVNPTSATASTISVTVDGVAIAATITVNGTVVTIDPTADLATGTTHTVTVTSGLKATDGGAATAGTFTFKSFGPPVVNAPQASNMLSYFAFNGNMNDSKGTHTPVATDVKNLTFATDRFGFAGFAGDFNGTTTIVEIPEGQAYLAGPSFTISFWIKANSTKNGQFVLGLGAWYGTQFEIAGDWAWVKLAGRYAFSGGAGGNTGEDNWFPGTGETKDNGGWMGWTFMKDVLPHGGGVGTTYFKDKWCHVVCTYDATTRLATMYLNGEKVKQHDFNLWPVGDDKRSVTGVTFAGNLTGGGNKLALGFIQASGNRIVTDTWADPADPLNNHFKGLMDDVRIWKASLTAAEVTSLYTAEKP